MGKIWANNWVFQRRDNVQARDTQRMRRVNDRFKCDNASAKAKRYKTVISKLSGALLPFLGVCDENAGVVRVQVHVWHAKQSVWVDSFPIRDIG
jgi:hypothetical protein